MTFLHTDIMIRTDHHITVKVFKFDKHAWISLLGLFPRYSTQLILIPLGVVGKFTSLNSYNEGHTTHLYSDKC